MWVDEYEVTDRDLDAAYDLAEGIVRSWGYTPDDEDEYCGIYYDAVSAFLEKLEDYVRDRRYEED